MTDEEQTQVHKFLMEFDSQIKKIGKHIDKVLDIGCGTGEFLYRINHTIETKALVGIDKSSLSNLIFSDYIRYYQYIKFRSEINSLKQSKDPIPTFKHYKLYTEEILDCEPISESEFLKKIKIKYNNGFSKSDFLSQKFDLILLNRVLHQIDKPEDFIIDVSKILRRNKYLFVSQLQLKKNDKYISDENFTKLNFKLVCKSQPILDDDEIWENLWWMKNDTAVPPQA